MFASAAQPTMDANVNAAAAAAVMAAVSPTSRTSASGASTAASTSPAPPPRATGGGTLHERLVARHHDALNAFRAAARAFNHEVDAAQQHRVARLHAALASSHDVTTALVATAQERLAAQQAEAQAQGDGVHGADPDDVLPVQTDEFHNTSADEHGRARALAQMKEERLRFVQHLVELRTSYCARMSTIDACFTEIAGAEEARRAHIQSAVHDLMASLTRIAVTSTTESQVLAQRILHHTNQQLGGNYLVMQTMATRLRQRELYKHQHYQHSLVGVYRDTQVCMAQQHVTWCITVLRSALFRRPEGRLHSVHAAGQLVAAIRSEAEGLVRGLTEVVDSLGVAQPGTVTAEAQVCGGSGANGWLRCFQPNVAQADVFVGEDPRAVLEEWQMRVSVLVRHCRARCDELVVRVQADEAARAAVAAALAAHTLDDIDVLARPLAEEEDLLQRASLAFGNVGRSATSVPPGETAGLVDDALVALLHAHAGVLAVRQSTSQSAVWAPCVPSIEKEGQWFTRVVARGFRRGYRQFSTEAVTSTGSMLVSLEGATDILLASTRGMLGVLRGLYAQWHEKEMDHRDEVAELEQRLRALEDELRQDETPAAAEARYTAGLMCLQAIADAHTSYYDAVRTRVAEAAGDVLHAGHVCVREVAAQAGMAWLPLTLVDDTEAPPPSPMQPSKRQSALVPQRAGGRASGLAAANSSTTTTTTAGPASGAAAGLQVLVTSPRTGEARGSLTAGPTRWTASHGEEFTIESIAFRFTCVTTRSGSNGSSEAAASAAEAEEDAAELTALAAAAPGEACQRFYLGLLPEMAPQAAAHFLAPARVVLWKEQLRRALVEWGLRLQRHAWTNWRLYTTTLQTRVQHRVTEVLRYHRRRPATLQANVYEARVRELEDMKNRGDKMLARIAERVSRVQTLKHTFFTQPAHSASDEATTRELAALLVKLREAMSVNTIKTVSARHDALCVQYGSALTDRCAEATLSLDRAREAIEEDCAQLLRDRAAELSGGQTAATLPPDDPVQLRVDHLRAEVLDTMTQSRLAVEAQQQARAAEVEAWKAEWDRAVHHSSAELAMFQHVQEGIARLKTQVQTLLTTAATEEAALSAGVARVVKDVEEAAAMTTIDLPSALRALFKDDPSTAAPPADGGAALIDAPLTLEELEDCIEHNLDVAKAAQRERVRGAPASTVLAALDELRGQLYTRGCRLGLLAYAVEMWRVPAMHYVLPMPLGEEGHEAVRSRMGSRQGTTKGNRRGKAVPTAAVASTAATGHAAMPLSNPATYAEQVTQWVSQVVTDAEAASARHVSAYPGELHRRLPGMSNGALDSFNAAVAALCRAQQERVRSYAAKASQPFRQRVQELWNALQSTPGLLVSTLRAEAMTAVLERVEAVLKPWMRYQALSSQQWRTHKSAVKLSFANQLDAAALVALTSAEASRSTSAESALQQAWARSLREVQDEVGLHVARCWTALHSYSHLLKGLVTPQHLVSTAEVIEGGQHRGLRHLLELRAQHERAAAAMEGTGAVSVKKEPRLQETMPLHRGGDASGGAAPATAGGKRHVGASAASAAAAAAAAAAAESTALVQPAQWGNVELPGLPLNTCLPLSEYNSQHPQSAVVAPLAAAPYVPAAAHATSDSKAGIAARRTSGAGATPSTSSGRRMQAVAAASEARAGVAEVSVPLLVPRAPLVLECVQLLRGVVQLVNTQGGEAAGVLSTAFGFYERQEAQWRQTWALTLKDLTTM